MNQIIRFVYIFGFVNNLSFNVLALSLVLDDGSLPVGLIVKFPENRAHRSQNRPELLKLLGGTDDVHFEARLTQDLEPLLVRLLDLGEVVQHPLGPGVGLPAPHPVTSLCEAVEKTIRGPVFGC